MPMRHARPRCAGHSRTACNTGMAASRDRVIICLGVIDCIDATPYEAAKELLRLCLCWRGWWVAHQVSVSALRLLYGRWRDHVRRRHTLLPRSSRINNAALPQVGVEFSEAPTASPSKARISAKALHINARRSVGKMKTTASGSRQPCPAARRGKGCIYGLARY